jgi:hypothetical protein
LLNYLPQLQAGRKGAASRSGEFYLEDVKRGRYPARLAANGHACVFEFVVPETTGPFTELPEIVCEGGRK